MEGLFEDFKSAATILKHAYKSNKLDASVFCRTTLDEDETLMISTLEDYFSLLDDVEECLPQIKRDVDLNHKPFVIVVEGLDGTGKSTLVRNLEEMLRKDFHTTSKVLSSSNINWFHSSTPTKSLSSIRAVFVSYMYIKFLPILFNLSKAFNRLASSNYV